MFIHVHVPHNGTGAARTDDRLVNTRTIAWVKPHADGGTHIRMVNGEHLVATDDYLTLAGELIGDTD
jgi:hypothetical protein